ncbi:MAG: hypothetical protein AB7T07_05075 [Steroidobacteraceae bacterium]
MQPLTLFMIVTVTILDFLAQGDKFREWRILPGSVSYTVELLGAIALVYVIMAGVRNRFEFVRAAYWVAFGALVMVVVGGVIVNGVGSGPIIAGLRAYMRALPWFFLPMVFRYSEEQLRTQLRLLLAICLVQVPIAIRQRIKTGDNRFGFVAVTGDWTTGTLGDAGILSIFLVCAVCVMVALYERRQLTLLRLILLFLVVLIPTTINETKAMVIFLPLALLTAFAYAAPPQTRNRRLVIGVTLLALFGAIFVPVYDALNKDRQYGQSIGDFLSKPENIKAYLSGGSDIDVGSAKEAGRIDALLVPLKQLANDPVNLVFGYGIGNASDSSLGQAFSGRYAATFRPFLQTAFSKFELEIGLLGGALVLGIYWLIFQDCRVVARSSGALHGALAAGWTGVVALMTLATFYTKIEVFPSLGFLFWYFSGVIAAERMHLSLRSRTNLAAKIKEKRS